MFNIMDFWAEANGIIRLSRQMAQKRLRPLGLTINEGNILLSIFHYRETASQDYLADQLDIDKATISRTVTTLENKGFLIRKTNVSDRRAYQLLLTKRALHYRPTIERIYRDIFMIAKRGVPVTDIRQGVKILSQIANNFVRFK
jgi:MarR family transcriptional regulator for hemolysin